MELGQIPAHHRIESFIPAPACQVYEILTSIDEWPEWQSGVRILNTVTEARKETPFKWTNGGMTISSVITKAVPCECLEWKSKAMWIRALINWELESEGDGCRIHYEQTIHGFGAALMKNALIKSMEVTLLELRKHAMAVQVTL